MTSKKTLSLFIGLFLFSSIFLQAQSTVIDDTLGLGYYFSKAISFNKKNAQAHNPYYDSIQDILQKNKLPLEQARFYNIIATRFFGNYALDSAYHYYQKSIALKNEIHDLNLMMKIHANFGATLIKLDSIETGLTYLRKSIEYSKSLDTNSVLGHSYLEVSHYFKRKSNYDSSLFYLKKSLEVFQYLSDTIGLIMNQNAKAILLNQMGFNKKSVATFYKALELDTLYDGYNILPTIYLNLGDLYSRSLGIPDSAEYFLNRCVKEATKTNNQYILEAAKVNLTNVYFLQDDFLKIIEEMMSLRNSKYRIIRVSALINTGIAFKNLKNDSARYFLTTGIEDAQKGKMQTFERIGYMHLYQYDSISHNYDDAFLNYQKYIALRDTINNQQNRTLIANLKTEYQLEAEKQEKEYWKKENISSQENLKQKTLGNRLLIGMILSLIALITFLMIFRKKNQEYSKTITQSNQKLHSANKELQHTNSMKNSLFSILSHDLKSAIAPSNQLLHLLLENYDSMERKETVRILRTTLNSSDNALTLMENLLEWIRTQFNEGSHTLKPVNLKNSLDKVLESYTPILVSHNIQVEYQIDENIMVCSEENIIETIARNLLSNAKKFTPSGGKISINGTKSNEYFELQISDNGIGIKNEIKEQLFDFESRYSSMGLNKETGSGIGLKLVYQMVKASKGNIEVESTIGKGTSFFVQLPICKE